MVRVSYEKLKSLQSTPSNIRNISILAHVDHGKTSVADILLAHNAVISKRQAGSLRYLDNRADEQRRGITMKSSTYALYYEDEQSKKEYLVNVIDSPGHIDFSSEVTAATRISDGCVIIVDVIEGVCAQTITSLEIAIREKCKMILVLNKIDRLITEKFKSPEEIYLDLTQLVESVNAHVAEIKYKEFSLRLEEIGDLQDKVEDEFNPTKRNVVFSSAVDGWAFRIIDFARIYSKQLKKPIDILEQSLWGDFYYDKKSNVFKPGAGVKNKKNLFISMILDNIFAIYESIITFPNPDKIQLIIEKLNIVQRTREMTSKDHKIQLRAIISEWLPLATSLFSSIVEIIPSPDHISNEKLEHIFNTEKVPELDETITDQIEPFIKSCSATDDAPILGYISKVYAINTRNILKETLHNTPTELDIEEKRKAVKLIKQQLELNEAQNVSGEISKPYVEKPKEADKMAIIALVRIFSGTIKTGSTLYVLPQNYVPVTTDSEQSTIDLNEITQFKVEELFLLLGKDLVLIDSACAGNIIGIGNIDQISGLVKSGTISSTIQTIPFIETEDTQTTIDPFFKCAIQPKNITDLNTLKAGLKLLMQTDSCAQCILQENGEYVLVTAGHVHLEKCIEDLKNYTGIEFTLSEPIVQLRECMLPEDNDEHINVTSTFLQEIGLKIKIAAWHMNDTTRAFFRDNYDLLKTIEHTESANTIFKNVAIKNLLNTFENLNIKNCSPSIIRNSLLSIGNSKLDFCVLLNLCEFRQFSSIFHSTKEATKHNNFFIFQCLINAFHLTIKNGPICGERLKNIVFAVVDIDILPELDVKTSLVNMSTFIKEMKILMHNAILEREPRILEPFYKATVTVNTSIMGKVPSCISQHRGKIIQTEVVARGVAIIEFQVPVLESSKFLADLRASTQGKVNPLLSFSDYEMLPDSPFDEQVPKDDDEDDLIINPAYKLMNDMRRRKGLHVDEKLVENAEKQRTLNKKK